MLSTVFLTSSLQARIRTRNKRPGKFCRLRATTGSVGQRTYVSTQPKTRRTPSSHSWTRDGLNTKTRILHNTTILPDSQALSCAATSGTPRNTKKRRQEAASPVTALSCEYYSPNASENKPLARESTAFPRSVHLVACSIRCLRYRKKKLPLAQQPRV